MYLTFAPENDGFPYIDTASQSSNGQTDFDVYELISRKMISQGQISNF